jgi:hypothetical protein
VVVGWVREESAEQTKGGGYDGENPGWPESVEALHFKTVEGTVSAVILDLHEAEVLWRGGVGYESEHYDRGEAGFTEEVERVRSAAAGRLAALIAEP